MVISPDKDTVYLIGLENYNCIHTLPILYLGY